jgi:hypothetical protein
MVMNACGVFAEFVFALLNAGAQDKNKCHERSQQPELKGERVVATVAVMPERGVT